MATLIIGGYFIYRGYGGQKAAEYEFARAERGTLSQTVEATGKIESIDDLSLRFETAGTLDAVKVKEGDVVKAGDLLANLRLAELDAAVAQASANLNQKLAGATPEDRNYYQAAADAAYASLEQAKADTQNSISTAEAAVETAKNNLKLAEGGDSSQIVTKEYEDAVALLMVSVSTLDNSLAQADNILGIDNTLANDAFENQLSVQDLSKLSTANTLYLAAKTAKNAARAQDLPLTLISPHADIDAALVSTEQALVKMNQLLVGVADVLNATQSGNNLTQASLETKKSTIETTRSTLTTHYTALINQKQAISDSKNSYSTYQVAYNKSVRDLTDAKASASATIAAKEAAYNQARANFQSKIVAPREVDVAYYRAALSQAVASRDKAVLKAPIDGVVTKVNKKKGESVSATDTMIQILSPHYEIKVDIPETDVAKLKIGDSTVITLDAFGDDVKFNGKIMSIEPASTEVQDVVYYKVTISLDNTDQPVKPGMTANVTITTASRENALFIPLRAVRTNGGKYVRILVNGKETKRMVELGLKGDDGKVEILGGLQEGEEIIVSVRAAQ